MCSFCQEDLLPYLVCTRTPIHPSTPPPSKPSSLKPFQGSSFPLRFNRSFFCNYFFALSTLLFLPALHMTVFSHLTPCLCSHILYPISTSQANLCPLPHLQRPQRAPLHTKNKAKNTESLLSAPNLPSFFDLRPQRPLTGACSCRQGPQMSFFFLQVSAQHHSFKKA